MSNQHPELFHRHELSPTLTTADWPYPVNSVFNPGATLLPDGTILLLCRVEDRRGHSHFCVARSANGVDDWQVDPQPTLLANPEHFPEEVWGIEGSRITYLMRDGTSQSPSRPRSRRKLAVSGSACTALGRPAVEPYTGSPTMALRRDGLAASPARAYLVLRAFASLAVARSG